MRRRGPGCYDVDVPLETSQRRSPPGTSTDGSRATRATTRCMALDHEQIHQICRRFRFTIQPLHILYIYYMFYIICIIYLYIICTIIIYTICFMIVRYTFIYIYKCKHSHILRNLCAYLALESKPLKADILNAQMIYQTNLIKLCRVLSRNLPANVQSIVPFCHINTSLPVWSFLSGEEVAENWGTTDLGRSGLYVSVPTVAVQEFAPYPWHQWWPRHKKTIIAGPFFHSEFDTHVRHAQDDQRYVISWEVPSGKLT